MVRLLDEGFEDATAFIAMDWVDGVAFPGAGTPSSWDRLASPTMTLFEILGRVHAAGVIHRDLKPANILVGARGALTLLDFGVSLLGSNDVEAERDQLIGTPTYMAPEQIRGTSVSPQTDLYACGVILYESLAGRLPYEPEATQSKRLLPRQYQRIPIALRFRAAPSLSSVTNGVPLAVCEVVDQLLAVEPHERPRSASDVLARLPAVRGVPALALPQRRSNVRPHTVLGTAGLRRPQYGRGDLRTIFAGPDPLFHLREDAARLLASRTDGSPADLARELEAWTRAGLARWSEGKVHLDRDALERLEDAQSRRDGHSDRLPPQMPHLFADSDHDDSSCTASIVAQAHSSATRYFQEGKVTRAIHALEEGLRVARRRLPDAMNAMECLLARWVELALDDATTAALDRVRYEIRRTEPSSPRLAQLACLVDAALHLEEWSLRSLSMLDAIRPFDDPMLERLRQGLRVAAARRSGTEERVLAEIEPWVASGADPHACTSYKTWVARLHYSQGRFHDAAALHAETAELATTATARCDALLRAASAWMEAFDYGPARRAAEEALCLAETCRHPLLEMRARWLRRSIGYRTEERLDIDAEYADAVLRVGAPDWEPIVLLTEAAIAWRAQRADLSRDLARTAYDRWPLTGNPAGRLLAAGLVFTCGGDLPAGERCSMLAGAVHCRASGVGVQGLALLSPLVESDAVCARDILALAKQVPRPYWSARLDVLSVRESLKRMGLSGG